MEKTQDEILKEILKELADIRTAIDSVESKLAMLAVVPSDSDDTVVPSASGDKVYEASVDDGIVVVAEAVAVAEPVVDLAVDDDIIIVEPETVVDDTVVPSASGDKVYEASVDDGVVVEAEPVVVDIFGEPVERPMDINEAHRATRKKSVGETMEMMEAWRTAIPGAPVKDVRSAISLNDRILFIRELFGSDAEKFQTVVERVNAMSELDEVLEMLQGECPEWDMNSDTVYRFMMAVRRRLRQE